MGFRIITSTYLNAKFKLNCANLYFDFALLKYFKATILDSLNCKRKAQVLVASDNPSLTENRKRISIGYHMSGEVISVLSLEGRYYNCHERAQRARDNYDIVTRVIKLISPSQSCDNLFITYLCLYQALKKLYVKLVMEDQINSCTF